MTCRKRRHSLSAKDMLDKNVGPYAHLNGTWFVKKIENQNKIYKQAHGNKFEEITKECFEVTMERSTTLPVQQIKETLTKFLEATNAQ